MVFRNEPEKFLSARAKDQRSAIKIDPINKRVNCYRACNLAVPAASQDRSGPLIRDGAAVLGYGDEWVAHAYQCPKIVKTSSRH